MKTTTRRTSSSPSYVEGTVASVFACTVTNSTLAGNPFGAEAIAAMASIFKENVT
jgi:hypothetical protein